MGRTFTYLLLLVLLVYGRQAYNLLISNKSIRSNLIGALSDIADEVITIPLQDPGTHSIKEAKYIRQEGDNLFLISNEMLYHLNRKGEFICRIAHPGSIRVAGYVVSPANRQLIVLGNTDDVFYYSFNGDLLTRKKLKCDLPEDRYILSISVHSNRMFTTEECARGDTVGQTATIKEQIVEYDSSFHRLQSHTIRPVGLERFACSIGCLAPEVAVGPGNETVYVHAPSYQPGNLLRDTLYIKQKRRSQTLENFARKNILPLLPARMDSHFWISTYYNAEDESRNYTFYYDAEKKECWQIKEGLEDNFCQTGNVRRMNPIDPHCHSYCFNKSGEDLRNTFPAQAQGGSPALFIVRLKG